MAVKDTKTITAEISAHIKKQGGQKGSWYVGTATRVKPRLHGEHQVPKSKHWYIWRKAVSVDDAIASQDALHGLGCQVADPGQDNGKDPRFVYAYLKTGATKP